VYQRRTWDEFKRVLSGAHTSQPVERAENFATNCLACVEAPVTVQAIPTTTGTGSSPKLQTTYEVESNFFNHTLFKYLNYIHYSFLCRPMSCFSYWIMYPVQCTLRYSYSDYDIQSLIEWRYATNMLQMVLVRLFGYYYSTKKISQSQDICYSRLLLCNQITAFKKVC
jgi:hypothetical protein